MGDFASSLTQGRSGATTALVAGRTRQIEQAQSQTGDTGCSSDS